MNDEWTNWFYPHGLRIWEVWIIFRVRKIEFLYYVYHDFGSNFFFLLYLFTLIGFSFFYSVLLIFFCCCPTGKAKKKKNWAIGQPTGRKTTTPKKATKVIHTNTEKRRDKHTPLSTPSFFVVLKQPTLYPFVILYIFIYLSIPPIHLLNWERVWEWVCIHIIIFLKNLLIHTQTCRFSHNCYFFFLPQQQLKQQQQQQRQREKKILVRVWTEKKESQRESEEIKKSETFNKKKNFLYFYFFFF